MDFPKKERILKLFGEYALFEDNEKDEARSYLNSWKKFLIRSLQRDSYDVRIIDEQWGEIPGHMMSSLSQRSSLYLKIVIEFDWHFSDGNNCKGIEIKEEYLNR